MPGDPCDATPRVVKIIRSRRLSAGRNHPIAPIFPRRRIIQSRTITPRKIAGRGWFGDGRVDAYYRMPLQAEPTRALRHDTIQTRTISAMFFRAGPSKPVRHETTEKTYPATPHENNRLPIMNPAANPGRRSYPLSSGASKRNALKSLRNYVGSRVAMTDYPSFRAEGYDTGSGPIESVCGRLTQRLKGSGMRWDKTNAESMMALGQHLLQRPMERLLETSKKSRITPTMIQSRTRIQQPRLFSLALGR